MYNLKILWVKFGEFKGKGNKKSNALSWVTCEALDKRNAKPLQYTSTNRPYTGDSLRFPSLALIHTNIFTCIYIYTTNNAYTIYTSKTSLKLHIQSTTNLNVSARQTAYFLKDKLSSLGKPKWSDELSIVSLKLASFTGTLSSQLVALDEMT